MSLQSGRAARNIGRAQVTNPTWVSTANLYYHLLPDDFVGLTEKIRELLINLGCPEPHHPNAWSAWVNRKVQCGDFVFTGEWKQCEGTKRHARQERVKRINK